MEMLTRRGGGPAGHRAVGMAAVLALLGACGDDPPDPAASASTTSAPPDVTSTSAAPASTTALPPSASSALAVVVTADEVAGWWDGQAWVEADGTRQVPVEGGEEYAVLGLVGPPRWATGSTVQDGCELTQGSKDADVPGVDHKTRPPLVAVSGVATPRPRETTVLDPQADVYREAARQVLRDKGMDPETAQVAQAVRADLEGDGRDEVLVVAERIAEPDGPYGREGDYSIAFLRRVVDEAVATTVVRESFNQPMVDAEDALGFIESFRVSAIADFNGDGRMEVALFSEYYEGAATAVHELAPDGTMPAVMSGGCGA